MGRRTAVAHRLIRPRARTCAPTEHMFKERLCLPESLIKPANVTQFQSCDSEALKCIWETFSRCQRSLSSHVFFYLFFTTLESWQQNQIQTLILKKTSAPELNEAIFPAAKKYLPTSTLFGPPPPLMQDQPRSSPFIPELSRKLLPTLPFTPSGVRLKGRGIPARTPSVNEALQQLALSPLAKQI